MTTLNRHAYENLIKEDLEWLRQQPLTQERIHIELILKQDAELRYGIEDKIIAAIKKYDYMPLLPYYDVRQEIRNIIFGVDRE